MCTAPGFCEWIAPARAAGEEELATEIAEVHAKHAGAYGCPRVTGIAPAA
ncbi:transposase [Amycolatopsis panacis]|nr:transposase [Amycolatopsis panacis]